MYHVASHHKTLSSKSAVTGWGTHELVAPHTRVLGILNQQGKHGLWRECSISE